MVRTSMNEEVSKLVSIGKINPAAGEKISALEPGVVESLGKIRGNTLVQRDPGGEQLAANGRQYCVTQAG